jgi:F0F1-type ATP synthase epsilon subunit
MNSTASLTLKAITPEGVILEVDDLSAVNVPLVDGGEIGIRPSHAPLIAETEKGKVTYRRQNEKMMVDLHAGILDIDNNVVTILTAGKIAETPQEFTAEPETEFDRMMHTLVDHLHHEDELEREQ